MPHHKSIAQLKLRHAQMPVAPPPTSPLVLCDRLITLAQDADRAGFLTTAQHLVDLAHSIFDEAPPSLHC